MAPSPKRGLEQKKIKNRRSLKRNKRKISQSNLSFIGCNAAGLASKLTSFDNVLKSLNPTVFFLQETKFRRKGRINTEDSKKYRIFELIRAEKGGGGLAIGALPEANPTVVSEGDDETEILVVQIEVDGFPIRCICAYGPQEYDKIEKKDKFWARLALEVEDSSVNNCATVIQMDGNLWGVHSLLKMTQI